MIGGVIEIEKRNNNLYTRDYTRKKVCDSIELESCHCDGIYEIEHEARMCEKHWKRNYSNSGQIFIVENMGASMVFKAGQDQ